uniref:Ras-associating domain-containing protein n=1 Tax=Sinocyclocheilus rhinocerous TaxID=307959 RepID=A0A673IZT8_9TELE
MQLTSQDKTPAVISRAMAKHNLEGEQAADYELVQVISEERELVIPDNANVFYAMSTSAKFDFLLRLRGSEGRPVQLRSRCSSTLPRTQQHSSLSLRLSKNCIYFPSLRAKLRKELRFLLDITNDGYL